MNKVRIEYNPYRHEISYQWCDDSSSEWMPLSPENDLGSDNYKKATLQSKVDEILETIVESFTNKAERAVGIVFCGTNEDYADLGDAIQRNKKVNNEEAEIFLSRDPESFYLPADEAAKKIDGIFEDLGDILHQDKEVEGILRQYTDAKSPTIPLCVIGAYSSGKSAFINALIGEDILPTGSDPLTARIYKVIPAESYRIAFRCKNVELRFEIAGCVRVTSCDDWDQCAGWIKAMMDITGNTDAQIMHHVIEKLNNVENNEENEELGKIEGVISIEVPFKCSTLPTEEVCFEIYDTPGSTSSSHQEHFDVLKEELKRRTNGLPILITRRDTLDEKDVETLLTELNTGISMDQENLMILINQAESEDCKNLETFHESPPKSVITNQQKGSIMFLSSALAIGCKCKREQDAKWFDSKCEEAYETRVAQFRDPKNKYYKVLPKYGVLPPSRYENLCQAAQQAEDFVISANQSEDAIWELIAQNSGIRGVESEIAYYAKRFADYNKCKMAVEYLNQAIQTVVGKINAEQNRQEEIKNDLSKKRDKTREDLRKQLNERKGEVVEKAQNGAPDHLSKNDGIKNVFKHTVSDTIKDQCKAHKNGKGLDLLQQEINTTVYGCVVKYRNSIHESSVTYWQHQEGTLKDALIQIVNGNLDISDEERELLKDTIAAYPCETPPIISLDFRKENIIKKKRFKIPFTSKEKVDENKCQEIFSDKFNDVCHDVSTTTREIHQKEFDIWSENLLNALTEKLDDFNEELRSLNVELQKSEATLDGLKQEKKYLTDADTELQDTLNCQEDNDESIY